MEDEDKKKENKSQDEVKKGNENGIGNIEESQIEQKDNLSENSNNLSQFSTIKNNNEFIEDNNQNFSLYNKRVSIGEMSNKENSLEASIIPKIKGDENENNLNNNINNSYYLGNLFRDVINKYDMEKNKDITESRLFLRRTLYLKNKAKEKEQEKEKEKEKDNENEKEVPIADKQKFNFNDMINEQLNEVKQNTLSYLEKAKTDLGIKYSLYIQKINNYINENEVKISKVIPNFENDENFINYADETIFKQIDYLLEIHDNIFSALEDHINLLTTFLDQISLIKQKNPFEYFLNNNSNDILNCWFLSKINFNKLSLSNVIINKDLSDLVSGYLCKKRENNFAKITIQKDTKGNLSLETEFLRDNINNLEKIKFLGLEADSVNDILNKLNKNKKNEPKRKEIEDNIQIGKKLHSLSIIDSDFTDNELPKFSLPVLRKVKIKNSKIPLSFFYDSIAGQTSFLKIINFQNCKLNDKDFIEFFFYLSQKTYLQESIQYLGFSGNELTFISLERFMRKKGELKNLQYFDLSKNNIYEFLIDNFKACPKMKVLDLSDNNISNFTFFSAISPLYEKKKMNCVVLMSNNIFVTNNKINNLDYRKYIHLVLKTFKFKIKKLNLTLLYNKDNIEELTTLRISPSVKISLIKLNLSFCGIKSETIWKFFQNNYGLLNLVSLNLSYNFISNNFFTLCSGQDILLEKLKVIDLSNNNINCKEINEFKQINKFISNYQKLKKIKIQKNGFGNDIIKLYSNDINVMKEINEIINKLSRDEIKFFVEMKVLCSLTDAPVTLSNLKCILEFKDKEL